MILSIKVALLSFMSLLIGTQPVASGGTTPYEVGPGRVMRDYVYTGTNTARLSTTDYFVVDLPVLAWATQTGSSTIGYRPKSICIPNPITKLRQGTGSGSGPNLNRGSGSVLEYGLHIKSNHRNVGGDLGFSKSCAPSSGSGTQLADNINSGTGAWTKGNTITDWNGADYLTLTLRSDPGVGKFKASLYVLVGDNGAE